MYKVSSQLLTNIVDSISRTNSSSHQKNLTALKPEISKLFAVPRYENFVSENIIRSEELLHMPQISLNIHCAKSI